jgi:MFS family permease
MEQVQNPKQITTALGLFSFVTALSGASVTLALPQMSRAFDVSSNAITQVVQIGLITTVIFLVLFGHAGDVFSKNLVYRYGGWVFTIGTAITGLAPSFLLVLVGRFIQAIGSAMVMANAMGIINDYFADKERARALAYNSMFVSVGSISGPAVGGIITSLLDWRWIFLLNIPVAIWVLIRQRKLLPAPKLAKGAVREQLKNVNWTGQLIFTFGVVLIFGSDWFHIPGFSNFANLMTFMVVGALITAISFWQDDYSPSPWINPAVLRNGTFLTSTTVLFLAMFANAFSNILLPFYLQDFLTYSSGASGLIVAAQSGTMLILSPIVGRLASVPSRRPWLVTIGLVFLTVSQVGYAMFGAHTSLAGILFPIVLNGIGMALTITPNNSITMALVDNKLAGVAGSMNSLFRTLGMALGISFASAFLYVLLPGVVRISASLGERYLTASRTVFLVAAAASAVGLLLNVWRIHHQDSKKS